MNQKNSSFISWKDVSITRGFWHDRMVLNETVTLPAEYTQCKESGRVDSIKCLYQKDTDHHPQKGVFTIDGVLAENLVNDGSIPRPHHYWDSDLAKWIEAAAYSLTHHPDAAVEAQIDAIVDDFEALQQPDGYLNTYYTVVEPGKRWTNVYRMHELYCAGHLIEAAVAYFEATGKRKLLDIVCRFVDCIDRTFGAEEGKLHGYPGHQEIELALIKLYHLTKNQKHLALASYFIDERGKQPHFFDIEATQQGRDVEDGGPKGILGKHYLSSGDYALFQAHLPVREQKTAEGHAVRLTYMGCAMADLAAETGDESLWQACENLWDNTTNRRMYITGGVGAQAESERFSFDYQLPNEEAYQETCASVGMVMWAQRMLQIKPDRIYADLLERALYNGVISGVSLTGDEFFYANHLAATPGVFEDRVLRNPRMFPNRQKWFAVSCCPMNLTRLTASIGGYIYAQNEQRLTIHQFLDSQTTYTKDGKTATVSQQTNYPWENEVKITVDVPDGMVFDLAIRIPAYSNHTTLTADGVTKEILPDETGYYVSTQLAAGYHEWVMTLEMQPLFIESHPAVRMNAGKVALQYGPLIYCLEEVDNGADLAGIYVDVAKPLTPRFDRTLLGGVTVLEGSAMRVSTKDWTDRLYRPANRAFEDTCIRAIPYFAWSNRKVGEMVVWINAIYEK